MAVSTEELTGAFHNRYPGSPRPLVYRAPGRVNLIGEHTDYNGGFVLPIALGLACYTVAAPASGRCLSVASQDLDDSRSWPVDGIAGLSPERNWSDYVAGVAKELTNNGYELRPMNLLVRSEVPIGSGLSSSAALEVAVALALLDGRAMDSMALARLCRRAENHFVGMPCGLMDQTISVFGEPQAALCIDCRDLTMTRVPLPGDAIFLAVNSMVKHELGATAYRERVAECQEAVQEIRREHPEVTTLRDADIGWLEPLTGTARNRAFHVVRENRRVQDFIAAAHAGDLVEMGRRMVSSHLSLQREYEVSCAELDFLTSTVMRVPGVLGSRMTGGGFGGCTVSLMRAETEPAFRERIAAAYWDEYGRTPEIYPCVPSPGAGPLA